MDSSIKALMQLQQYLEAWVKLLHSDTEQGEIPSYIPRLAAVDRHLLAVQVRWNNGAIYNAGNVDAFFPLMSVVKPFVLIFLLQRLGPEIVWQRVGQQPSDQPYNSLLQLETDRGWPRNPMLNSGAIALCDLLPGETALERCETLRQWLNQQANCDLFLDTVMLESVQSKRNERNQAIATLLHQSGYLHTPNLALETYNAVCCLAGTIADLTGLGMLLAVERASIQTTHRSIVNEIMLTCGLYEYSQEFAQRIGLPTKSGVSGILLTVIPENGAIGIYSPPLDRNGNSLVGLKLLEQLISQISAQN